MPNCQNTIMCHKLSCIFLLFVHQCLCWNKSSILLHGWANSQQFPYMALLLGTSPCTGTILTDYWILSVARCFNRSDVNTTVLAGAEEWLESAQRRRIVLHILHHTPYHFDKRDIAILKVNEPFVFNSRLWPITIANISLEDPPTHCLTLGFSKAKTNEFNLLYSDTAVSGNTDCANRGGSDDLCGFETNSSVISCFEQHGGSLVCDDLLVGVLVGTYMNDGDLEGEPRCGDQDLVHVYTTVFPFLAWMRKYIPELPALQERRKAEMKTAEVDSEDVDPEEVGLYSSCEDLAASAVLVLNTLVVWHKHSQLYT